MSSPHIVSYYVIQKLGKLTDWSFAGSVILDCGCGFGRNGHLLRSVVDAGGSSAYLIGCDIFKNYILETKRYNPYDELVLCDIRHLPFKFGSIDHIIASEVIEHLEKKDGKHVLKTLKKLCSGNVILTTPYFPFIREETRNNPFEKHRSFWKENEFKGAGFETEVRGYEELLSAAVKKLRLDRFISKIGKIVWRPLICHLIILEKKKKQKSLKQRNKVDA